jgi:flagellar hook-length control protein FliK
MMTALTDLLSSAITTGKLKAATSQEQAQNFANAMDELLAKDQCNPSPGTDHATAAKVDALPGDVKQPMGSAELQFVMDEATMDMIKSGQSGLSGSADPLSTRSDDASVGQPVSGVDEIESSSGSLFNQTMSDLWTTSTGGGQPSLLADRQSAELTSATASAQTVVSTQENALLSSDKTSQTVAEGAPGRVGSDVLSALDLSKTYIEAQALKSTELSGEPRVFLGEGLRASSLEQAAQSDPRVETLADKPSSSALGGLVKTDLSVSPTRSLDAVSRTSVSEPQQFGNEMATHVRVLKRQGGGEVKINLHPAELGRMSITVVTEGTETRVAFVVETPQARQAVETAMPRLRDMMDEAGLSLADSDVSEQHQNNHAHDHNDALNGAPGTASNDVESPLESTTLSVALDPSRLVDTYI